MYACTGRRSRGWTRTAISCAIRALPGGIAFLRDSVLLEGWDDRQGVPFRPMGRVLRSHQPPLGVLDESDEGGLRLHYGSEVLAERVVVLSPVRHVHGVRHASAGRHHLLAYDAVGAVGIEFAVDVTHLFGRLPLLACVGVEIGHMVARFVAVVGFHADFSPVRHATAPALAPPLRSKVPGGQFPASRLSMALSSLTAEMPTRTSSVRSVSVSKSYFSPGSPQPLVMRQPATVLPSVLHGVVQQSVLHIVVRQVKSSTCRLSFGNAWKPQRAWRPGQDVIVPGVPCIRAKSFP